MSSVYWKDMVNIFVDTDILIDFTYQKNKILYTLFAQKKAEKELCINPVVITEFLTDRNLIDEHKLEQAYSLLDSFHMIEINVKIGILAGELLREGKISFLSDALIAATCLVHDLSLATRNLRHFGKVPGLTLYSSR